MGLSCAVESSSSARRAALRVAITVDPEIPVPPTLYGGIERIVDMLVRGLLERGHKVTLFANPKSKVPCDLHPYAAFDSRSKVDTLRNMWMVSNAVRSGGYDVIHNFARLAYVLPLLPLSVPKLMSYQREITPSRVAMAQRMARGTIHFSGCSQYLIRRFAGAGNWHVVYNGVPAATYTFSPSVDDEAPLLYLGRIEEIKGVHLAIEVSRRSRRSLVIAGNVPREPQHRTYFETRVKPYIDGAQIKYVGPVDDPQKDRLLGRSAALLMPLQWDEPFGIVMTEALACGTPIIGLRRGSLPEIVQDGINGFVCGSVEEMVAGVARIGEIDRLSCRRVMEERFSDRVVVECYEQLYRRMRDEVTSRVAEAG